MSSIQYGLALAAPSKQTLLPVMLPSGKVYGFFPIASTTFTGAETTFALANGSVAITTVTLPPKVSTNIHGENRVQQYMAAVFPTNTERTQPWRGYPELVPVDIPNDIGYYSWWSMPVTMWFNHFGKGAFLDSMTSGMANFVPSAADEQDPPTITTPKTLEWACTMNLQAFTEECAFFDFNWVALFNAVAQADPTAFGNGVIPLSISTVSNPATGEFKASVVQGHGGQTIVPGGGVQFNTVRILRLHDPEAGAYVFNFAVTDNLGQSVPAVLTLTIV